MIHFRGSGTTVFFSSYGKDGKTGLDIYRAEVLPGGTFSEPERLSNTINSPYDEDYPFLHPDNKTFYFSSKGHTSMGGFDVFKSNADLGSGSFSSPVNLDFAVNTPDDDLFYIADSAKNLANFASARSSKQGELHVYRVKVASVAVNLTLIKGSFKNKIDPAVRLAKITVVDAATNKEVDVQYTDPTTGDYVLSFPKSGKYKFLVEAEKSERIHAGIVDIPATEGIKALLQEMELVSSAAVEKLVINNLFDQQYEGDVMALARNLLLQKAALDVNFNKQDEPLSAVEEPLAGNSVDDAYRNAGFGAGMSNADVLGMAKERVMTASAKEQELIVLRSASAENYNSALNNATNAEMELESLLAKAEAAAPSDQTRLMYEAGRKKMEAQSAVRSADNSASLVAKLDDAIEKAAAAKMEAETHRASLQTAIESEDFDAAVSALSVEKQKQEDTDKVEAQMDIFDAVQTASIDSRNEAQRCLDRASAIRAQAEETQAKLITKKRQVENAKGKSKGELEAQVETLKIEVAEQSQQADRAFEQAIGMEDASANTKEQYEILNGLSTTAEASFAKNDLSAQKIDDAAAATVKEQIDRQVVENTLVAAYLSGHPEIFESFDSPQQASNFKKQFAIADETLAAAEEQPELDGDRTDLGSEEEAQPQTALDRNVKPSDDTDVAEPNSDRIAKNTEQSPKNLEGKAIAETKEVEAKNPFEQAAEETSEERPAPEPTTDVEENEVTEIFIETETEAASISKMPAALEDDTATAMLAPDEIAVDAQPNIAEMQESSPAKLEPTERSAPQSAPAIAKEAPAPKPSQDDTALTKEMEKRDAASDWISIIDASIAELEQGVGTASELTPAERKEQLNQYQKLKNAKSGEIAASDARIRSIQAKATHAPAAETLTDEELISARKEINAMDNASLARLESKIPEASSEKAYLKSIQAVDANYIAELTAIELSGKSAPEMAIDRIALNRAFIVKSSDLLDADDMPAKVEKDDVIELRRIKTLELINDELVMQGKSEFRPRSAEARDYARLLAEADKEKAREDEASRDAALSGLSPEIRRELDVEFTNATVMPGYDAENERIAAMSSPEKQKNAQLALYSDYLEEVQSDIQLYAAALKAQEGKEEIGELNYRYAQLLAERSKTIDKVDQTKAELAALNKNGDATLAENNTRPAVEAVPAETDADDLAMKENTTLQKVVKAAPAPTDKPAISESIKALFASRKELIRGDGLSPRDENIAMAELNLEFAESIDYTIASHIKKLDASTSEKERDQLQIEIQKLDDLAADMRQESDRLNSEAGVVATVDPVLEAVQTELDGDGENDDEIAGATAELKSENQKIAPEQKSKSQLEAEKKVAAIIEQPQPETRAGSAPYRPSIDPDALAYKSLNANIAMTGIRSRLDSIEDLTNAIGEKQLALSTLTDQGAQQKVRQQLSAMATARGSIEARLEDEVRVSNAAEIDYYDQSNTLMLLKLKEAGSDDFNDQEGRNQILARGAALSAASPSRTGNTSIDSQSDIIEKELNYINELSQLNEDLIAILPPEALARANPMTDAKNKTHDSIELVDYTFLSSAELYVPEDGKTYLAPIHIRLLEDLSQGEQNDIVDSEKNLSMDFRELLEIAGDDEIDFIQSRTSLTPKELEKIRDDKVSRQYLAGTLKADSIRRIEQAKAAYLEEMMSLGTEKMAEANRLRNMAQNETLSRNKAELEGRAGRIELEAIANMNRAALGSVQAESLRTARKAQESLVAESVRELNPKKLDILSSSLSGKQYSVVRTDLASADRVVQDVPAPRPKGSEPTAEPMAPANETAERAPDVANMLDENEAVKPEKPTDAVYIDRNTDMIDADLLAEASGNWLNAVEIIAQKDDFSEVKESLFLSSSTVTKSAYSNATPIPINPAMPSGLVFQVQVGAFRNNIPQDLFGEFAPVMGEELGNGITRYRAGIFRAYRRALEAKTQIRTKGYSDAFVVAYVDGERLTGAQAQQILAQARTDENITSEELLAFAKNEPLKPKTTKTTASEPDMPKPVDAIAENETFKNTDYYNDPEAAEASQVEIIQGLFFTVQVGVYSKPVRLGELFNLNDLNSELTTGGTIRYTTGRYASVMAAQAPKQDAIGKGVTDAFITAYYNGQRISVAKAQEILNQEGAGIISTAVLESAPKRVPAGDRANSKAPVVRYVVIMGTFSGDIPQEIANVFLERDDLKIRRITSPSGESMYLSPEFENRQEADELLRASREAGITNALMGKSVDGEISLISGR